MHPVPFPAIGTIVHYVSHGSPDGTYKSECRAAMISGYTEDQAAQLVVFNPTGLFFNICYYDHPTEGGTWHIAH